MPETLPGSTAIELRADQLVRGRVRAALFDFDGTLSLVRSGWQDVMIPMFVEHLSATPHAESAESLEASVREWVDTLTGKQTIYQTIRLAEEVARRGGTPREPLDYKHEYLDRLWTRVSHRVEGLEQGALDPDELLVPGSRALLENLRARGIVCHLASGTDLPCVEREARALRVDGYFASIGGALDDYKAFSKALVIDRLFAAEGLAGPELLSFGDGYVEIENTVAVGGIAVGVASDEERRAGIDEWKRNRLLGAGAHLIVPDFREQACLLAWLLED